jgi:hypothetical protein
MREYHREECERVIRYGEAYAARHGLEWVGDSRYPRLKDRGEGIDYAAWYVESASHCARALLHGRDLRYAFRCYVQVRTYGARLSSGAPDGHWRDLLIGLQNAMEECLGLVTDYVPNNCDCAQVPRCAQCGQLRFDDAHRCL